MTYPKMRLAAKRRLRSNWGSYVSPPPAPPLSPEVIAQLLDQPAPPNVQDQPAPPAAQEPDQIVPQLVQVPPAAASGGQPKQEPPSPSPPAPTPPPPAPTPPPVASPPPPPPPAAQPNINNHGPHFGLVHNAGYDAALLAFKIAIPPAEHMPEFPTFPGDELISNEDLVAHRATSAFLQLRHIDYNNTPPFLYGNFRALYSSLHQVLYHHYPPNEYARIALPTDLHIENRRLGWREYCLKPEGYRTEKIFRLPMDAAFTASYHKGAITMFDFASPAATYNLRVYAPGLVPTENDKCSVDYCLGSKALSYSFPQQVYMSGYLPGRRNYSHLTCIYGYEVHWACLYTKFMMTLHYHSNECRGAKFDAPLATAAMRAAYCCGECSAEFVEAKRNTIRGILQAYYCCLGIVPEFDYHHGFGYEAALDQTHAIAGAATELDGC